MYSLSLGFLAGTSSLFLFSTLPSLKFQFIVILLIVGLWKFWKKPVIRLICALLLGFFYSLFIAHSHLNERIPTQLEGKKLQVIGTITNIPHHSAGTARFYLNIEHSALADQANIPLNFQGKVKLAWYHTNTPLHSGERWQLQIKLKRPHSFINSGSSDYERWLFHQGITATGYVRTSEHNQRLATRQAWQLNAIRETIHQAIQTHVSDPDKAALISALSLAIRDDIEPQHWEIFRNTGTSHLIAISGLHIGMIAGFALLPISVIWLLFPALYVRLPLKIAVLVLGAVFATAYALLAGFTIPTQRALIMVLLGLSSLLLKQKVPLSYLLAITVFSVLLIDPLAGLSEGFWLSFFAVGLIFYLLGQKHKMTPMARRYRFLSLQLFLSLGMIPITAMFFSSASLISPIANLVAIPWVTLIVAPSLLLGILLLSVSPLLSDYCFAFSSWGLDKLLGYLGFLSEFSNSVIHFAAIPIALILLAIIGVFILALPRGMVGRYLGVIFIAPLFLLTPKKPLEGEFKLTVLDVGQGLATVLQTQNHVMVFDTGDYYSDQFDMGSMVVLPYLQSQQIRAIDKLVISHADKDHSGGANAILQTIPVVELISNERLTIHNRASHVCQTGQTWIWDQVKFEVLSPNKSQASLSKNNRSCVIKVSNHYHSLLLVADIERKAEYALLKQNRQLLKADVLLVPHHGSKTSSAWPFIAAVQPKLAIISAGYRNRFNFPHEKILFRYHKLNIARLNTSQVGEIQIVFPNHAAEIHTVSKRIEQQKFWMAKPLD